METTESKWTNIKTFELYENLRQYFRPANARIVRAVLTGYAGSKHSLLEIGSGIGELVQLVPEYKNQVQQTEISIEFAKAHKAKNPDSNIIVASAYQLPFAQHSIDAVVGYSVFDVFHNLIEAVKETSRVLRDKGYFIHFLDMQANNQTIIAKYQKNGPVPFLYWPRTFG